MSCIRISHLAHMNESCLCMNWSCLTPIVSSEAPCVCVCMCMFVCVCVCVWERGGPSESLNSGCVLSYLRCGWGCAFTKYVCVCVCERALTHTHTHTNTHTHTLSLSLSLSLSLFLSLSLSLSHTHRTFLMASRCFPRVRAHGWVILSTWNCSLIRL